MATTRNKRVAIGSGVLATALAISGVIISKYEPSKVNPGLAYADKLAGGKPTACEGHTGPDVVVGVTYSPAQCAKWKHDDQMAAVATINQCLHPPKPLSAHNAAALIDAVYNDGPVIVCGSTLQKLINAGAPASTWCPELLKFNKYHTTVMVDGRPVKVFHVSAGLDRRRRTDDTPTCLTGD